MPKSTEPSLALVTSVRSGIGAPSSPETVKVNLPVMSAGARPSAYVSTLRPTSAMDTGSPPFVT